MSREAAREVVARLVARYIANRERYASSEAQVRVDFINPLLEALGWDLENQAGLSFTAREVQVEEGVELADDDDPSSGGAAGNPDYTIQPDGRRRFFVEAKKPAVAIATAAAPAFQTRRYGWSAGLSVSVLTNFAELVVYDCRAQPHPGDGAEVGRIPGQTYRCEEYVDRFDNLWRALSKESVLGGTFDEEFAIERELRGQDTFDDVFLGQIRRWRLAIASDLAKHNLALNERAIARTTQRLLNRLVFLRVCEDRNIETYGELLKVEDRDLLDTHFRAADKAYNAGLFRALDDIAIDTDLLHKIIAQLYYPQSPYAFSVVDAPILASIYEQFLAERIELAADRSVKLVRKPEIAHAGGIVPTPGYIVAAILDRVLKPALANSSLDDVRRLRIIDPACGSGVFLLQAFRAILDHFAAEGVEPSLGLKHEILRSNIFGVDIDSEAVEVTRFNLLLAVLEGEDRESVASFDAALLPDIDSQIVSGNSLITPHFLEVYPETRLNSSELLAVNPFDFTQAFPEVMGDGGFDVIVGNPPYVRIQTLAEFEPLQVAYFQTHSLFKSASAHNFDKYLLFIERAIELLGPRGRFGYVVPHRFMATLPGGAVRELLSSGGHLREIVHFGYEQVFPGATTYVCLLIGAKEASGNFTFEQVDDLAAWRDRGTATKRTVSTGTLGVAPWGLGTDEARAVFAAMTARHSTKLRDVADIFVGVQTSADDVYLVKAVSINAKTITFSLDGKSWTVESEICRPALRDRSLLAYDGKPEPDAWAIFPYEIDDDDPTKASVIPPDRMQAEYPFAWEYLTAHRDQLEARSISPSTPETWYRYGRSQSLAKLDTEKIILRVLSLVPQYNWDPDGLLVPGGGDGGPYYLIRPKSNSPVPLAFLIALLSHPVIDAMVWEAGGHKEYRGGYFPHRKTFLEDLPVPVHDLPRIQDVSALTRELIDTTIQYRHETDAEVSLVLERDRATQRTKIEAAMAHLLGLSESDLKAVVGE
jgi:type I restriction-modification system DNA methylase subunit